jgi:threonine/homoserine/homoserine lactone efflux protein
LRRRLLQLPEAERNMLAEASPETQLALPKPGARPLWRTTLVAMIGVNGPLLPFMLGPLWVMQTWFALTPPVPQLLALAGGCVLAWLWWSVAVSYWRRWAQAGGMSAAEVQYHGERINILWPPGHVFARTEWGQWRQPPLSKRHKI